MYHLLMKWMFDSNLMWSQVSALLLVFNASLCLIINLTIDNEILKIADIDNTMTETNEPFQRVYNLHCENSS